MDVTVIFIGVGVIAVASAILMLLSENAVHSALFLIVNFTCVAFLYLMLDAPFLAMIQIAVYAGAIMVLFLFVIMLLGAEKLTQSVRQFRWLAPLSLALALAFLLMTGLAVVQGQIDLTGPVSRAPMFRVVHAAPYAGTVDIYANGQPLASNVEFGGATEFETVPSGEYIITLNAAGTDTVVVSQNLLLAGDPDQQATAFSAIIYGGTRRTPPVVALIEDNLESVPANTGRITIFNATSEQIDLVNFNSLTDVNDDTVLTTVAPAATADLLPVKETPNLQAWAFTAQDNKDSILFRLNTPELFNVRRDTAQLIVLTNETLFDDSTRVVAVPLVTEAVSSFGGPHAVGELLFTRYMLPFQLIAILLLAAMIGAIVLTHKEDFVPRRRDVRRRVMQPLTSAVAAQIGQDISEGQAGEPPQLPGNQPAGD